MQVSRYVRALVAQQEGALEWCVQQVLWSNPSKNWKADKAAGPSNCLPSRVLKRPLDVMRQTLVTTLTTRAPGKTLCGTSDANKKFTIVLVDLSHSNWTAWHNIHILQLICLSSMASVWMESHLLLTWEFCALLCWVSDQRSTAEFYSRSAEDQWSWGQVWPTPQRAIQQHKTATDGGGRGPGSPTASQGGGKEQPEPEVCPGCCKLNNKECEWRTDSCIHCGRIRGIILVLLLHCLSDFNHRSVQSSSLWCAGFA